MQKSNLQVNLKTKINYLGEPLVQRVDDNAETLKKRLAAYHAQTVPVIGYYTQKNLYAKIDASLPQDQVWNNLKDIFSSCLKK